MPLISILISEDTHGMRLDRFLQQQYTHISFPVWQKWLRKGNVRLDKKRVKGNERLVQGQTIKFHIPDDMLVPVKRVGPVLPTEKDFKKAQDFMDTCLLTSVEGISVFNKPAGLAVQGGNKIKDSVDYFLGLLSYDALDEDLGTKTWRMRLTHRLDKDTSGLLVVAHHPHAAQKITQYFKKKIIQKAYIAIVAGVPDLTCCVYDQEKGLYKIDQPLLKEDINGYEKVMISEKGKPSVTYFDILEKGDGYSVVILFPQTGRTHQLRVHMQYCGSPILGDWKYGNRAVPDGFSKNTLFLHAYFLKIPVLGEFFAPCPYAFCAILGKLHTTEDFMRSYVHKYIEKSNNDIG